MLIKIVRWKIYIISKPTMIEEIRSVLRVTLSEYERLPASNVAQLMGPHAGKDTRIIVIAESYFK